MGYKISGAITQNCKIRFYDTVSGTMISETTPRLTGDYVSRSLPDTYDPQGFNIFSFEADAPGAETYDVYAKSNVDGRLWTFGDVTPFTISSFLRINDAGDQLVVDTAGGFLITDTL